MHAVDIDSVSVDLTERVARAPRAPRAHDRARSTRRSTQHGLGMSEFEVLERLACECGERPRMQDLAAAAHLSQSALSRTVGRLEKDGLVMRAMCPEDRRGIAVCLTTEGARALRGGAYRRTAGCSRRTSS